MYSAGECAASCTYQSTRRPLRRPPCSEHSCISDGGSRACRWAAMAGAERVREPASAALELLLRQPPLSSTPIRSSPALQRPTSAQPTHHRSIELSACEVVGSFHQRICEVPTQTVSQHHGRRTMIPNYDQLRRMTAWRSSRATTAPHAIPRSAPTSGCRRCLGAKQTARHGRCSCSRSPSRRSPSCRPSARSSSPCPPRPYIRRQN
jgi:hypothetical protein